MRIRQLLVPTDFSSHSSAALDTAIQLARTFGARLHLLHAYQVGLLSPPHDPFLLPPDVLETVRQGLQDELDALAKRAADGGVECETYLSVNQTVGAILDLAGSVPADLIVMGTRGLTGLRHVALGSVAERTVRLAPCPVMTLKVEGH